jgi:ubiquitin C-terminal hydrolase
VNADSDADEIQELEGGHRKADKRQGDKKHRGSKRLAPSLRAHGDCSRDGFQRVESIEPLELRRAIGQFNEQFNSGTQQDAHELLACLLDGLSEDLNRVLQKPYVEMPDSDGRCDADLADEWWRKHLYREVSGLQVQSV